VAAVIEIVHDFVRSEDRLGRDFRDDPIYARLSRGNGSVGLIAPSLRLRQNAAARASRACLMAPSTEGKAHRATILRDAL
jgi:hypothetical protein